jgi:hypothetical protein
VRRALLATLLVFFAPAGAFAQSRPLEQATARIDEADFAAAGRILDEAEAGSDLSRDELVQLYASRAAVSLALGHIEDMARDVARLDALEPDFELDASARPELREALAARPHQALRLDLRVDAQPGAASILGTVSGDPGGLTREVHLRARAAGTAAWTERTGDALVLPATDAVIEYWGEVIGPGGAVLAATGSAASPLERRVGAVTAPIAPVASEAAGGTNWLVIGLGVGAGIVAVGLVIVLIAMLSGSSNETQPGSPQIFAF